MAQFIHEILTDFVNGDREVVVCNGVEMSLETFKGYEPEHADLPEEVKGYNYVPNVQHYAYGFDGGVVSPIISTETLDGYLSRSGVYQAAEAAKVAAAEVKALNEATNAGVTG